VRLDSVLQNIIPVQVPVTIVHPPKAEDPTGILLCKALLEAERVEAVIAEADIDQPLRTLERPDLQHQMVEWWTERLTTPDTSSKERDFVSKKPEEVREQAVQLVTEAASAAPEDFVGERLGIQADHFAEMDAEVLERDLFEMRRVQQPELLAICAACRGDVESAEITGDEPVLRALGAGSDSVPHSDRVTSRGAGRTSFAVGSPVAEGLHQ
jgi:hypothetical protein